MDHCIVYFSTATAPLEAEELTTLLGQSRINNTKLGVTGVLLYVRGSIIQVLEGEKQTVEALYERIAQDQRHTNVSLGINRPISNRLFSAWSMGFETITTQQLDTIKTLVDLENSLDADESIILKTIKVFYQGNRYN